MTGDKSQVGESLFLVDELLHSRRKDETVCMNKTLIYTVLWLRTHKVVIIHQSLTLSG